MVTLFVLVGLVASLLVGLLFMIGLTKWNAVTLSKRKIIVGAVLWVVLNIIMEVVWK